MAQLPSSVDVSEIVKQVLLAMQGASQAKLQKRGLSQVGSEQMAEIRAGAVNNVLTAPSAMSPPTSAPKVNLGGSGRHLVKRQRAFMARQTAGVTNPNIPSPINLDAKILDEARKFVDASDKAWEDYKQARRVSSTAKAPEIVNPNALLTQVEVLDVLGQCAPQIHALCHINHIRGPWLWVPTVDTSGASLLPKHPDIRAFLRWLGFDWVGGRKMWVHKVNHKASGRFRRGTHNLESELRPV